MTGWTKMPLGMEVGLGPGDYVFDGDPATPEKKVLAAEVNVGPGDVVLDGVTAPLKGAQPPVFGSCLLWPNGWKVDLGPGHIVRWRPSSPRKGHSSPPPSFRPCLLWPRSPISAIAELLYNILSNGLHQIQWKSVLLTTKP